MARAKLVKDLIAAREGGAFRTKFNIGEVTQRLVPQPASPLVGKELSARDGLPRVARKPRS
jgi:hypothetical protein